MKPVFSLLRERQIEVTYQEPLAAYTTRKIGGHADLLITPSSKSQLIMVLQILNEHHVPWMVMGKGSNLLLIRKIQEKVHSQSGIHLVPEVVIVGEQEA